MVKEYKFVYSLGPHSIYSYHLQAPADLETEE
jgi:hypothetical protein